MIKIVSKNLIKEDKVEEFKNVPGKGIIATINGQQFYAANESLIEGSSFDISRDEINKYTAGCFNDPHRRSNACFWRKNIYGYHWYLFSYVRNHGASYALVLFSDGPAHGWGKEYPVSRNPFL